MRSPPAATEVDVEVCGVSPLCDARNVYPYISGALCDLILRVPHREAPGKPMKKLRDFCLFVATLYLLCGSPLFAQSGPPADLDAYVARDMRAFDVPGIA